MTVRKECVKCGKSEIMNILKVHKKNSGTWDVRLKCPCGEEQDTSVSEKEVDDSDEFQPVIW